MSEGLMTSGSSISGSEPDLVTLLVLFFLWISGALQQIFPPPAPARPSTIRLAAPRLVAISDREATEAAHLLGSSVAALAASDWGNP